MAASFPFGLNLLLGQKGLIVKLFSSLRKCKRSRSLLPKTSSSCLIAAFSTDRGVGTNLSPLESREISVLDKFHPDRFITFLLTNFPLYRSFMTSAFECLQGENAPFCHICEVGCYVIVQLKRFFMIDGVATKNAAPVVCSPYLSVPVRVDDEVTGSRKFALVSGICHSGTLTSGHYTAFVWDNVCGVWLHYNDKAVTRTTLKAVNGPLPYILFYKAC